jgi:predicted metal-binding membrane protein
MRSQPGVEPVMAQRDRVWVAGLVLAVAVLAWAYTIHHARLKQGMDAAMMRDMAMPMNDMPASWTPTDAFLIYLMWTMMMAAMMVPAASPMIAAFAAINRRRHERQAAQVPTIIFLLGYLLVWSGFALMATMLQWALQSTGLLTTMMQSSSTFLSAALFLAAGLYQFSPLKERCLAYCRSPQSFILTEWRDGALGAAVMGMRHGLFCMACCAALMVLLFAVAVMDLRWVAALTALVTVEKLLPAPRFWRMGIGFILLAIGTWFAGVSLRPA